MARLRFGAPLFADASTPEAWIRALKRKGYGAAYAPLERILLETDAPYMPPVPHRGERNDSRLLPFVAETAARVKGCTPSELIAAAAENGKRLFGIL